MRTTTYLAAAALMCGSAALAQQSVPNPAGVPTATQPTPADTDPTPRDTPAQDVTRYGTVPGPTNAPGSENLSVPGGQVTNAGPRVSVPGGAKIKTFAQFDVDDNGVLGRMEFAQAMMFLLTAGSMTTGAGADGQPLPAKDKYVHAGMTSRMAPGRAVALLNATSDEFAVVDLDRNGVISEAELVTAALM